MGTCDSDAIFPNVRVTRSSRSWYSFYTADPGFVIVCLSCLVFWVVVFLVPRIVFSSCSDLESVLAFLSLDRGFFL